MNCFPDFAPNSRKEWGLSLFNQFCENELENYRNFWNFWKLFNFIQFYSIVSLDTARGRERLGRPNIPLRFRSICRCSTSTPKFQACRSWFGGTSQNRFGRLGQARRKVNIAWFFTSSSTSWISATADLDSTIVGSWRFYGNSLSPHWLRSAYRESISSNDRSTVSWAPILIFYLTLAFIN